MKSFASKQKYSVDPLRNGAVQRHRWDSSEVQTLIDRYRSWSQQAGPRKLFKLKDFVMSTREDFPFFEELPDKNFYERVKRTLYRVLTKTGMAWRHAGKTRLETVVKDSRIKNILEQLEQHGVGIATDGSVLLVFPIELYTHQPDEGYFVASIPHAINHLKKIVANAPDEYQELKDTALQVVPLLREFVQKWKEQPSEEATFKPKLKQDIQSEGYAIKQDPENSDVYEIHKPDGTVYYCNVEEQTCTCPAGQAGRVCKHLLNVTLR